MLPWEVIRFICEFCPLSARYVMMSSCKYFKTVEWPNFGRRYGLTPGTKYQIKTLVTKGYSNAWHIVQKNNSVWSMNLNRPLLVWSPWSTMWFQTTAYTSVFFREYLFLKFIRYVGAHLKLKTRCIQRRQRELGVRIRVWKNARLKDCHIIQNSTRCRRVDWQFLFKRTRTRKVRALMSFRVAPDTSLRLVVQCLEFLVS